MFQRQTSVFSKAGKDRFIVLRDIIMLIPSKLVNFSREAPIRQQ
jgi:hypothetical protein